MTAELGQTEVSGFTRGRRAFRGWRKRRPFWGGFFLLWSGFLLFWSSNLDFGNLTFHLGPTGYLSYVIPLVTATCGALVWASPSQRMFYAIVSLATVIYSIIALNLGGWLLGLISGMFGASLSFAWIPNKRVPVPATGPTDAPDGGDAQAPDGDADTTEIGSPAGAHGWDDHDDTGQGDGPDGDASPDTDPEGEQSGPFRGPRHAAVDHDSAGDEASYTTTGGSRRGDAGPDRGPAWARRRGPAIVALAGLTAGTFIVISLHAASPAAAGSCVPSATDSAIVKLLKNPPASPKKARRAGHTPTGGGTVQHLPAGLVPVDAPGSGIGLGSLVGGLLGLLGGGSQPQDTASPSGSPTDTPTGTPTDSPTATPTPTDTPTGPATPTASPTPKPTHTHRPTPSPTATGSTEPAPGPTTPATPKPTSTDDCATKVRALAAGAAPGKVAENPGTLTADRLDMTGLSYDGLVELPTASGTIEAMQFSMDSSTSTPFKLVVTVGTHTVVTTSTSLTVSGHVTFYAAEIKGNLLGTLPVDFTPQSPPPAVTPDLFFTDATVSLVDVISDSLTATKFSMETT